MGQDGRAASAAGERRTRPSEPRAASRHRLAFPPRLRERLLGPRVIDPPLRLFAGLFAVAMVLPSPGTDLLRADYLTEAAAAVLLLVATVRPTIALVLILPGEAVHAVLAPADPTPFLATCATVVAVSAAGRRWRLLLVATGVYVALMLLGGIVSPDRTFGIDRTEPILWLLTMILGLSAAVLQARIDAEIRRRERAARLAEQELQRLRVELATDTHDTVSHALATEAAIIRMMGRSREEGLDERVLSELALVNARAQRQLRQLLARLHSPRDSDDVVDLRREIPASLEAIRSGARAGGFDLLTARGDLPGRVESRFAAEVQLMLFELATNVLKHACSPDGASVRAGLAEGPGVQALLLVSRNVVEGTDPVSPRTLTRRARALGGDCSVGHGPGSTLEVRVLLPVPALPEADPPGAEGEEVLDGPVAVGALGPDTSPEGRAAEGRGPGRPRRRDHLLRAGEAEDRRAGVE
ncbi:hypothetical protein NLU66_07640 [Brachybacterium sp. NBEC-018]|uniref:hypothetical protein n=1 Tax=Brachybacterium sp. NBEC-018 TaxID=2996004 RepID=UPI0021756A6F|nr:hypothetical protein [Brachybacterium sp. NBEC-018]UVY85451.1 hypothetical protein NLU66_07640 [Brachybacterium sp. NBEC-018]